ncbi:MAG TPA: hypothetical protein VM143_04300 [Acidimicrobiales bacterium]|nr:hypothetical protein [Acidimicrobiales bacterium]
MKPPWWTSVAPAVASRRCAGAAAHELLWERGELILIDHGDATAEATLGALGGSTPTCLRVARAWHDHRDDPVLITLGRRAGEAGLGLGDPPPPGARTADVEEPTRRDQLLLLFTLPAPLIDRLVLGAADAAAQRWPDPDFRARHGLRLGAALAARVTPALRRLGGELAGPDESLVVHATPAGPGDRTTVLAERSDAGLEVTASIQLDWVSTVWGPGISEPAGRMVLAVRDADGPDRLHVDLAEWHPDGLDHWEAVRVPALLSRSDHDVPWEVAVS